MVDSPHQPATRSSQHTARHRPTLRGRADPGNTEARQAILDLVGADLRRFVDARLDDDERDGRISGGHTEPPLRPVVDATIRAVCVAGRTGRLPDVADRAAFEVLGVGCCGGVHDAADALAVLDACAEAIRDLVLIRGHRLDELFGEALIDRALASLCGVIEVVSTRASDALLAGHSAAVTGERRDQRVAALVGTELDHPPAFREPENYDPIELRSVCVLYGSGPHVIEALSAAARDAELLIPHAVDAGVGTAPPHRRVVIERRYRTDWKRTAAIFRELSRWHGLDVRVTAPTNGRRRLADAYRSLLADIAAADTTTTSAGLYPHVLATA
ncbi:MAG TPA: hypothetical protein VN193_15345 [Candidatus Angelobacter sp.]|jgi:hypothetical protein|nr:hypothetical protein [Candidatus Angelobacter sp.]